jgi:hypothetical protein
MFFQQSNKTRSIIAEIAPEKRKDKKIVNEKDKNEKTNLQLV